MNIKEILKKEFNKDKLSKIDLHMILELYLKEESEFVKKMGFFKSFFEFIKFTNFFFNKEFNKDYEISEIKINKGNEGDNKGFFSNMLFTIFYDNEEIVFCHTISVESNKNRLSLIYGKNIDDIKIEKSFVLERNNDSCINSFYIDIRVDNLSNKQNYLFYSSDFDTIKKDMYHFPKDPYVKNNFYLELSKKTRENNYMEESFFEMADLKYDFNNSNIKLLLLNFFNSENFGGLNYLDKTFELTKYIKSICK